MADNSVRGPRWWVVGLPTILLLIMSAGLTTAQICSLEDTAALLEFRRGFIDEAGYFWNWNSTSDCCSWQGVSCESGRVVELRIHAFFSPGFPARDRAYSGQVGATLGDLRELQRLNIENVRFDSAIPNSLGNLVNLEYLKLRQAGLHGDIPESFCNLTKLKTLELTENEITGTVPSCVSVWNQITTIRLAGNQLSGTIPEVLVGLSNLTELDLAGNGLAGNIPNSLQNLRKLEVLSFSDNSLSGNIPSSLTNIKSLRFVALDHNQLTGGVSSWWYRLENLTDFKLNDNQLGGAIFLPSSTEMFAPLQILFLQNNKFSGTIPAALGNFRGPLTIDLSNNKLTGIIPESLGNNNTFGTLLLSDNQLTGGFPLSLTRLQTVKINRNKLDNQTSVGEVPTDGFNVISELWLGENQLVGPWPSWITELVNLTSLDLSSNNITGSIPVSLLILETLQYSLNVSNNPLNIPIPCGDFVSNVGILDMTNTGLTGTINACFFKSFPFVSSLFLGENQLFGELPSDLPTLVNPLTNILDLSNNHFTGRVPRFFELQFLMYLDLIGNSFQFGPL